MVPQSEVRVWSLAVKAHATILLEAPLSTLPRAQRGVTPSEILQGIKNAENARYFAHLANDASSILIR